MIWIGLGTAVLVALATGLDLLRPAARRPHLGRFASPSFDGHGEAWTTIKRKVNTNIFVLQNSDWALMVPIAGIFAYCILVIRKGWNRLTPARSITRIALVATVAVGVLGGLVNDSGVVVTAVALVYVGPLLALLELDEPTEEPELLEPAGDHPAELPDAVATPA